jgi:hypothetical protein
MMHVARGLGFGLWALGLVKGYSSALLRLSKIKDPRPFFTNKEAVHATRKRLPVNCWDWPEADCVLPEKEEH